MNKYTASLLQNKTKTINRVLLAVAQRLSQQSCLLIEYVYGRKLISQQVGAPHCNHAIGKWSDTEEDYQDEEE